MASSFHQVFDLYVDPLIIRSPISDPRKNQTPLILPPPHLKRNFCWIYIWSGCHISMSEVNKKRSVISKITPLVSWNYKVWSTSENSFSEFYTIYRMIYTIYTIYHYYHNFLFESLKIKLTNNYVAHIDPHA